MFKKLFGGRTPAAAPAAAGTPPLERAQQLVDEGNRREDGGDLQGACDLYRQAVRLAPAWPKGQLNLGIGLAAAGDTAGAARAYEAALAVEPGHPYVLYNYANLVFAQGDAQRAETLVRQALRSRAAFAEAQVLLANLLAESGRAEEAVQVLREAVAAHPDYAGAHHNLAVVLRQLRRPDEARPAAERAVALHPGNPDMLAVLAGVLADQGFAVEAIAPLQEAVRLAPDRHDLHSAALFQLNFDEAIGAREGFERHAAYGRRVEGAFPADGAVHGRARDPQRKLRLAFLSHDFRVHPVSVFLLPLLERLDRSAFEVTCYATGDRQDHVTERVRALSDRWQDVRALADAQLTQAIRADGIDVLVDLIGHTASSRLPVFARRAAPLQLTWMAYLNTTGLARMDYRITDARCDPPALSASLHTEKLALLPQSQWCFRPFVDVAPAVQPPCVRNGYVTFGSFNHAGKISAAMGERWADLLQQLPDARLLVADVSSAAKQAVLRAAFVARGIAPERVRFAPRVDLERYYALYGEVDIALDTYPYGGGTTSFDALWMGVPVLTASGEWPASRSASSILQGIGLQDWIAADIAGYVPLAAAKARDTAVLAALRGELRQRLASSPFMDEPRFARDFEATLRRLWQERCATA